MRKINLEDIVNELELISDDGISFLNKTTGQFFHFSSKEMEYAENGIDINRSLPEWQIKKINNVREIFKSNNYVKLPTKNEINEHGLMINFLRNNPNQNLIKEVVNLEQDNNVNYWQLRKVILQFNIGDEWYRYKREAFQKIAIDWCYKNAGSIASGILQEIKLNNHL